MFRFREKGGVHPNSVEIMEAIMVLETDQQADASVAGRICRIRGGGMQ